MRIVDPKKNAAWVSGSFMRARNSWASLSFSSSAQ
jgi:hypothetical protein